MCVCMWEFVCARARMCVRVHARVHARVCVSLFHACTHTHIHTPRPLNAAGPWGSMAMISNGPAARPWGRRKRSPTDPPLPRSILSVGPGPAAAAAAPLLGTLCWPAAGAGAQSPGSAWKYSSVQAPPALLGAEHVAAAACAFALDLDGARGGARAALALGGGRRVALEVERLLERAGQRGVRLLLLRLASPSLLRPRGRGGAARVVLGALHLLRLLRVRALRAPVLELLQVHSIGEPTPLERRGVLSACLPSLPSLVVT